MPAPTPTRSLALFKKFLSIQDFLREPILKPAEFQKWLDTAGFSYREILKQFSNDFSALLAKHKLQEEYVIALTGEQVTSEIYVHGLLENDRRKIYSIYIENQEIYDFIKNRLESIIPAATNWQICQEAKVILKNLLHDCQLAIDKLHHREAALTTFFSQPHPATQLARKAAGHHSENNVLEKEIPFCHKQVVMYCSSSYLSVVSRVTFFLTNWISPYECQRNQSSNEYFR